jgi:hypothetical protein
MEEKLMSKIVEQIYPSYSEEKQEISRKFGITHKGRNLNYPKIKRDSNLKDLIDQYPERLLFVDKRTLLFVDKNDRILYAFMSEQYFKDTLNKFKRHNALTYITSLISI